MLITDKKELQKYTTERRLWQGIPSIEVTKKGRIFSTFYSGGVTEQLGNYAMLVKSDNGVDFSEPIAVAYKDEKSRCFDPCIWIDPLGRLWFTWSLLPNHGTYAVICDDPDADELEWSDVFFVGHDVMMNKPTVLSTGEWYFPIAVWNDGVRVLAPEYDTPIKEKGSFVYKTIDNGKTFEKLGCSQIKERDYDEHMVLELSDGRLAMYVRTAYGIGVSHSYDRGRTWTEGGNSGLIGPSSRFFIGRLPSGRVLFVNNDSTDRSRINMTAFLSDDDGVTWSHKLLLDDRKFVSYPDVAIGEDGYIYITYDRDRGAGTLTLEKICKCEREILFAKITEEDIIQGKLVSPDSKLKCIISKLGKYYNENENPFGEVKYYTDEEFANILIEKHADKIVDKIFEHYSINCMNMYKLQCAEFDGLVEALNKGDGDIFKIVKDMIALVRSVSDIKIKEFPIVETIKKIIMENQEADLSIKDIAKKAGISMYYMMHTFKKATGTTITEYKTSLKITCAKKLLISTDKSILEISQECGFGSSSYFSKVFMQSENVSPSEYRNMHKK